MARLVYSCRAQQAASCADVYGDYLLKRKFYEWRFGEYERCEKNEVLRELIFHPHRRTPREVWQKAEELFEDGED